MALNASVNWYVRAGGNALNGGGWDPLISGAGVNYADADAAVLSLTDLATSGAVATVTSATGGFTANMVGNCLRIASGTNFTAGYYFIVTYTNTNTVVLDRACATAAGSGGTGRIGGAFATPWSSLASGGTLTAPTITSPLAAGHTVWIRGAGSDVPSAADYTQPAGYATYPNGDATNGRIRFVGYNGRPRIDGEIFSYTGQFHTYENLWLRLVLTTGGYGQYGIIATLTIARVTNVVFDQNGVDKRGLTVTGDVIVSGCSFINNGSSSSGTYCALQAQGGSGWGGNVIVGSRINGWRGAGIDIQSYAGVRIEETVVANCRGAGTCGIVIYSYAPQSRGNVIRGCSIYGALADGISVHAAVDDPATYGKDVAGALTLVNNIVTGSAGYGIRLVGTQAVNDRARLWVDHNAFCNNTSGSMYLLSAGDHDITLTADPFIDAANGDLRLNATAGGGAALKDVAFPTGHPAA